MGYKHKSAYMLVGCERGRDDAVCSEQYYRGHESMEKEQFNAWDGFRDGKGIERASLRRWYLDLSSNRTLFLVFTWEKVILGGENFICMSRLSHERVTSALLEDCTSCPISFSAWLTSVDPFRSDSEVTYSMMCPLTTPGNQSVFLLP